MADTKFDARIELLYATTTDPASGAARQNPTNYTKIGLVADIGFSGSTNMIDVRDKDSGGWADVVPGAGDYSIDVEGNRARDGNAGQTVVENAFLNKTKLHWLRTTNVIGDKGKYGSGYVESYDEGSPNDDKATFSATLTGTGEPITFTVT